MAKKERFTPGPTTQLLHEIREHQNYRSNWLLREWLSDDGHRKELYRLVNATGGVLEFPTRDVAWPECDCPDRSVPPIPPRVGHEKRVRLITDRAQIIEILHDQGAAYSNRVYADLGGGSFMLALDPHTAAMAHAGQRAAFQGCFPHDLDLIAELSEAACRAASILSLNRPEFDLAQFAEQAALRFCQKLMGYASTDYGLLQASLRTAYSGLVYQVMGRHFVNDPLVVPAAKLAMGRLLARTSALIDAYARNDEDELKGCDDPAVPSNLRRVLQALAHSAADLNGEQRAVIAVGCAVGTVGNVQAAVCIAVKALFADETLLQKARGLARRTLDARQRMSQWNNLIQHALVANPPIPFLPRRRVGAASNGEEVLLALGGGTQDAPAPGDQDPLIWGLPGSATHWCAGNALGWPLIVEIVRHVMALPGLDQGLDAEDASVSGLKKRWGFACESYPLTHQRERRVHQSSLNVAMRLRSPVRDSADRVREVIRSGAPRIEEALRSSRHVHFAWFELTEGDTVLVLHTVYDGPFAAYIQHFALKVGEVFDALFACIENPPPTPVDKFPNEFVAHIQRYDRPPAMGYFFSAYPGAEVTQILRDNRAAP